MKARVAMLRTVEDRRHEAGRRLRRGGPPCAGDCRSAARVGRPARCGARRVRDGAPLRARSSRSRATTPSSPGAYGHVAAPSARPAGYATPREIASARRGWRPPPTPPPHRRGRRARSRESPRGGRSRRSDSTPAERVWTRRRLVIRPHNGCTIAVLIGGGTNLDVTQRGIAQSVRGDLANDEAGRHIRQVCDPALGHPDEMRLHANRLAVRHLLLPRRPLKDEVPAAGAHLEAPYCVLGRAKSTAVGASSVLVWRVPSAPPPREVLFQRPAGHSPGQKTSPPRCFLTSGLAGQTWYNE